MMVVMVMMMIPTHAEAEVGGGDVVQAGEHGNAACHHACRNPKSGQSVS
jgi:hypothetical protein